MPRPPVFSQANDPPQTFNFPSPRFAFYGRHCYRFGIELKLQPFTSKGKGRRLTLVMSLKGLHFGRLQPNLQMIGLSIYVSVYGLFLTTYGLDLFLSMV